MRLKIHNINKVQEADVRLDGLTVIAGANSSGKSTVGKLLFSMVKSMANAEEMGHQSKREKIQKRVNQLYSRINGCFSRNENPEVDVVFPLPSSIMVDRLLSYDDQETVRNYLDQMLEWFEIQDIAPRIKSLLREDIENIRIATDNNQAADVASEVRGFIESEFMNGICSHGTQSSEATLEMSSSDGRLSLSLEYNKVRSVSAVYSEHLADATYVESPLYLHILDTLLAAMTYREYQKKPMTMFRGMVPVHIKDLASKLYALQLVSDDNGAYRDLGLSEIMGGRFVFDNDSKTLRFTQDSLGLDLSPINIASGIKSFGLIQILLETHVISNNKILIWDEPENHLHPKWQVAFAEVLVKLAKMGIPVVISTHSPYFVQGVRYFAVKHDIENYTNFYLAEEQSNRLSVLNDVTHDLNRVFSKLAEPLQEIMNVDQLRREKKTT